MPTVTDICNAAISHCGTRSKISSIDEGSPEANACTTHFDMARDATLRAFDWNFARLTVALADLGSPPQRWSYRYALPSDCLRVVRLNDVPVSRLPASFYELAAATDSTGAIIGVVLTDLAPISAIYTARVTDPLRWDAGFADVMAYGLASRICFELTGKEERQNTLFKLWQGTIAQASAEAANEGGPMDRPYVPEVLRARGFDGGGEEW